MLSDGRKEELKTLTTKAPIMVFMKGDKFLPQCGFSGQMVDLLEEVGVEFETFDILEDESVRQDLKEYSMWPTYPQLYVRGELIGGIDIATEMNESGELQKIFEGNKAL